MEFVRIDKDLRGAVIALLRESFFADEPLNKSVNLCKPGEPHAALEALCTATIDDGLSIAACEKGQVMGVALNGILCPGDIEKSLENIKKSKDESFKKIFTILYATSQELDLFNSFKVDRILEGRIIAVSEKARGRGLATCLMERSLEIADKHGFPLFKADATGAFSQRVCAKLGMRVLHRVPYAEYRDSSGAVVFRVEPPHEALAVMVLPLPRG